MSFARDKVFFIDDQTQATIVARLDSDYKTIKVGRLISNRDAVCSIPEHIREVEILNAESIKLLRLLPQSVDTLVVSFETPKVAFDKWNPHITRIRIKNDTPVTMLPEFHEYIREVIYPDGSIEVLEAKQRIRLIAPISKPQPKPQFLATFIPLLERMGMPRQPLSQLPLRATIPSRPALPGSQPLLADNVTRKRIREELPGEIGERAPKVKRVEPPQQQLPLPQPQIVLPPPLIAVQLPVAPPVPLIAPPPLVAAPFIPAALPAPLIASAPPVIAAPLPVPEEDLVLLREEASIISDSEDDDEDFMEDAPQAMQRSTIFDMGVMRKSTTVEEIKQFTCTTALIFQEAVKKNKLTAANNIKRFIFGGDLTSSEVIEFPGISEVKLFHSVSTNVVARLKSTVKWIVLDKYIEGMPGEYQRKRNKDKKEAFSHTLELISTIRSVLNARLAITIEETAKPFRKLKKAKAELEDVEINEKTMINAVKNLAGLGVHAIWLGHNVKPEVVAAIPADIENIVVGLDVCIESFQAIPAGRAITFTDAVNREMYEQAAPAEPIVPLLPLPPAVSFFPPAPVIPSPRPDQVINLEESSDDVVFVGERTLPLRSRLRSKKK